MCKILHFDDFVQDDEREQLLQLLQNAAGAVDGGEGAEGEWQDEDGGEERNDHEGDGDDELPLHVVFGLAAVGKYFRKHGLLIGGEV